MLSKKRNLPAGLRRFVRVKVLHWATDNVISDPQKSPSAHSISTKDK